MSTLSYIVPSSELNFLTEDGKVNPTWYLFLSAVFQTIGGPQVVPGGSGISPSDNTQQFEEFAVTSPEAMEALRAVDELRNDLAQSRSDYQRLVRDLDEFRNALATIPAAPALYVRSVNSISSGDGNITVPGSSISGVALTANNLSDLASAPAARTNLGLGTLATQSGTFSGTSSGTNTGDQTIALTGGVTGSGTGSFAATVVTNANLTGPITSTGNATSVASQTGTGSKFVMDTSPVLVTPNLGTPSALVATNASGTAASLTAGHVTTNANFTGPITSVGNATSIASQTGTGSTFVMSTAPSISGTVTSNQTAATNSTVIAAQGSTTGTNNYSIQNTGGTCYFGRDSSTGTFTGVNYADFWFGSASNPFIVNINGTNRLTVNTSGISVNGTGTISGGFGCNGKTAQTSVVSDGTLATVIVALKANGIMS